MSQKIFLNIPEVETQASALRRHCDRLKDTGDKYQKMMDAMSNAWKGSSGRSFSEAAGRVEAGFVINRSVLEQMIYDVTATRQSITAQDTLTAKSVESASMTTK
ncbi:MAG: WXG100 family type VII secretion target [Oscillospiraceae bacterium]|nr:WXG100 family type VII secretion target [Oscillospiraceae bacterium]